MTQLSRNWVVVQWSTHALNLLRYVNLSKYLGFCAVYTEEEVPGWMWWMLSSLVTSCNGDPLQCGLEFQ